LITHSLVITALALGTIPVSSLHVCVLIRLGYENLSSFLGPLRETSFPELRRLCILLQVDTDGHETRGESSIDFMTASAEELQHWTLRPSVADSLESVVIDLRNITDFHHTTAFLELFGHANRPGVLRVSSGGARLLD
jgi:hypothetical protein